MKPAGKSEARVMLSANFSGLKTCFNLAKPMLLSVKTVKAFAAGANAFQIRLGVLARKAALHGGFRVCL
jgi:hypothetical protein